MNHGGKRPGAGRYPAEPGQKKIPVGYKLTPWLVEWLRAQDRPAAQLIEEALVKAYGLNRTTATKTGNGE